MVIALAVGAAAANAWSSVLQRSAARRLPAGGRQLQLMVDLARRPAWALGIAVMVGAFLLHAAALARGPLSRVQPLLVTELIFVLVIRAFLSRHPLGRARWLGAAITAGGLGMFLGVAAPGGPSKLPPTGHLLGIGAAAAATVAVCALAARRGTGARRATLFGVASGTAFALTAALTKLVTNSLASHGFPGLLAFWPPYALAVAGAGAVVLAASAFRSGPLVASQAALTVVDPLVSVLIGVSLFGEHIRSNPLALGMEGGALALVGLGALLLCSPTPTTTATTTNGTTTNGATTNASNGLQHSHTREKEQHMRRHHSNGSPRKGMGRRRLRRLATVAGLATLVVAGACGSTTPKSTTTSTASTGSSTGSGGSSRAATAQTRTVQVDGHTSAFNATFTAYFPKSVMVHPGDTVAFHLNNTGEPHSVTMGTLVTAGLAAAAKSNPNGPPPPAFAQLPQMLPQGPGDAIQAGAAPCFLATGSPPTNPAQGCPKVAQPAFDGTQSFYSSGALMPGSTYTVHLAKSIKPGTYPFYCDLHGPDMTGAIVVVASSTPIPGQSQVDAQAQAQLQALAAKLQPAYQAAKAGHAFLPGNLAGYGAPQVMNAQIDEFIPSTIHAKVGQPVTFTVLGAHTVTVGGPDNVPFVLQFAPDGSVHIRSQLVAPAGGPGQPQQPPSSGPPPSSSAIPKPTVINGGDYAGTGLHSSGLVISFPPQLYSYSLTFTKAGTYTVDCEIHPHMEATVVVSP